jgi:hypothetical protein
MLIWCTIAPDIVYGVASLVSLRIHAFLLRCDINIIKPPEKWVQSACVLCRYVVAHHVCDRRYTVHSTSIAENFKSVIR